MVDTDGYDYQRFLNKKYQKGALFVLRIQLERSINVHPTLTWPITESDVTTLQEYGLAWTVKDLVRLKQENPDIVDLFYEEHVKFLQEKVNGTRRRSPLVKLVYETIHSEQHIPIGLEVRVDY